MQRIGIVGFGFMGQMHFRAYSEVAGAKVTALFDADPETFRRAPAQGNLDGGGLGDIASLPQFSDYEAFLRSDVDVVDICTPTFLHRELAERALRSGRAVLCEKPMALTTSDCDAMIQTAKQTGKLLMVAQCVRFWPGYDVILEACRSGAYGRPLSATLRRVGGVPGWSGWFLDARRSGGGILDCLVHDFDFARAAFGLPSQVSASGTVDTFGLGSGVSYSRSALSYPGGPASVTIEGGWLVGSAFPFSMTAFFQFQEATLAFGIEPNAPIAIYRRDGSKETPEPKPGQGYAWEIRYFLECLEAKKPVDFCPPTESRDAIGIAIAARDSIIAGKPVRVV